MAPQTPASAGSGDDTPGLVWDLPLRIAHWGLALAVTGAFVSHERAGTRGPR